MDLSVKWEAPFDLLNGGKENLIYTAEGLDDWQDVPGVYMFARIFNSKVIPLYIGEAEKLGKRARQHFKRSTFLMNSIKKARNGKKVLILGRFSPKPGQRTKKSIELLERVLIYHALNEGYQLFNKQGTRTPGHKVNFSGYLGARNFTGTSLSIIVKTD
jgi:hypothetical protein